MKILVFPRDLNLYQELLYKELSKLSVEYDYLEGWSKSQTLNFFEYFPKLLIFRLKGYNLFHLHWLYKFQFPSKNLYFRNYFTKLFFTIYLLILILWIKLLGYKMIFTVHNITPHESVFINDLFVSKIIGYIADKQIVHSASTLETMKERKIRTNNAVIIPMGNYINNNSKTSLTKLEARVKLGLKETSRVFLFFGLIRPYKGLDSLIPIFNDLFIKNDSVELFIVGEPENNKTKKVIEGLIGNSSNIHTNLVFVTEAEIPIYFKAADVSILPYKQVTTSAAALLSLGHGVPLIAPRIGHFVDFPEGTGFYYNPGQKDSLANILKMVSNPETKIGEKKFEAQKYASSLKWEDTAKATLNEYKKILSNT